MQLPRAYLHTQSQYNNSENKQHLPPRAPPDTRTHTRTHTTHITDNRIFRQVRAKVSARHRSQYIVVNRSQDLQHVCAVATCGPYNMYAQLLPVSCGPYNMYAQLLPVAHTACMRGCYLWPPLATELPDKPKRSTSILPVYRVSGGIVWKLPLPDKP